MVRVQIGCLGNGIGKGLHGATYTRGTTVHFCYIATLSAFGFVSTTDGGIHGGWGSTLMSTRHDLHIDSNVYT